MINPGFYKFTGDFLSYASTGIYAPNFTLRAEDRSSATYPVDGWFWFDSKAEAEAYFGINGAAAGRWLEFGAALAADAAINQFVAAVAQSAPVLHLMIGVGLGQASQGDARTFLEAWGLGMAAQMIPANLQAYLITLASGYDLPQQFIDGLQPQNPQTEP
jgi:hypothetical protein